jgi:hypothetical protein
MENELGNKIQSLSTKALETGFLMGSVAIKAKLMTRLQPYLEHIENDLLQASDIITMVFDEMNEFDAKQEFDNYRKDDNASS